MRQQNVAAPAAILVVCVTAPLFFLVDFKAGADANPQVVPITHRRYEPAYEEEYTRPGCYVGKLWIPARKAKRTIPAVYEIGISTGRGDETIRCNTDDYRSLETASFAFKWSRCGYFTGIEYGTSRLTPAGSPAIE
jgi:hypothetical protein